MAKRGNRHRIKLLKKEAKRDYLIVNVLLTSIGASSLIYGIFTMLFLNPSIGVSLRYLQPRVNNGGLMIIVGLILLGCLIYRLLNKNKVLKNSIDNEINKDDY